MLDGTALASEAGFVAIVEESSVIRHRQPFSQSIGGGLRRWAGADTARRYLMTHWRRLAGRRRQAVFYSLMARQWPVAQRHRAVDQERQAGKPSLTWRFVTGAGEGNRTLTVSLGS